MPLKEIATCITLAAGWYDLPSDILFALHDVEGGSVGMERRNTNGSIDMGPMQINSLWVPHIAKEISESEETVKHALINDPCFNVAFAASLIDQHLEDNDDPVIAIGHYHSRTPRHRDRYIKKFVKALHARVTSATKGTVPKKGKMHE